MVESSKETSAVVGYHMLLMTATTHRHTEHSLCSRLCVKRFPDSVGFSLCVDIERVLPLPLEKESEETSGS